MPRLLAFCEKVPKLLGDLRHISQLSRGDFKTELFGLINSKLPR